MEGLGALKGDTLGFQNEGEQGSHPALSLGHCAVLGKCLHLSASPSYLVSKAGMRLYPTARSGGGSLWVKRVRHGTRTQQTGLAVIITVQNCHNPNCA